MDYSFNGLPLHILIVHVTVILVPVAAAVLVVAAVWPRARRWLGLATPILGILAAIAVPFTTQAGAWLQARLPDSPLIQKHADLGETLWPWTLALAVLSVIVYGWYRVIDRRASDQSPSRAVRTAVAVVLAIAAIIVGPVGIVTTVVIGESGADAVWQGSFTDDPIEK